MFHIFLDLQNLIPLSMILGWNLLFQMTKYENPKSPYELCLVFILERFVRFFLGTNKTIMYN